MITDEIIHGDCTRILPTLPNDSVGLIVTDPPYGVRYHDRTGRSIANDDCLDTVLGAFPDLYRVLKPDSLKIRLARVGVQVPPGPPFTQVCAKTSSRL